MALTYADVRKKRSGTPEAGGTSGTVSAGAQTPRPVYETPVVGASTMGTGAQTYASAQNTASAGSGSAGGGTAGTGTQTYASAQSAAGGAGTASDGSSAAGAASPAGGNGAYQTTYIDSDGNIRQGYIIGGVTYKDAAGTERIDAGTRVLTQGGEYILRGDGTSQLYSDYLAENRSGTDYLETLLGQLQTSYREQLAAGDAAAAAATQQAINNLEAQKGELNTQYDDLNRQLYIDRRQNERTLPQQLAAMGYTGGLSESSLLNLGTGYEEALRQNESDRARELSGIDRDIANARLEGELNAAQQRQNAWDSYYGSYANVIGALAEQSNWRAEYDSAENKTRANSGWTKLEAGIIPANDELDAMGLTYEQALAYINGGTGGFTGTYSGTYGGYSGTNSGSGDGTGTEETDTGGGGYDSVAANVREMYNTARRLYAQGSLSGAGLSGESYILGEVMSYLNQQVSYGNITGEQAKEILNSLK